jgi:cytochrome c oxidase subunit 2
MMISFLNQIVDRLCPTCSSWQSMTFPEGPSAASLNWLFWAFTVTCGFVWLLVMLVLLMALSRRVGLDSTPSATGGEAGNERGERRSAIITGAAVGATVLIIGTLTVLSYAATSGLSVHDGAPLVIKARGYQWWWQFTYDDPAPDRNFITANEIHIPVGRMIRIELSAADVIHSFWVPNLAGKQDLIPGRDNVLTLMADRPGVFRGQCAEFCGLQHAHMALLVVAETPDDFEVWRDGQTRDANKTTTEEEERGRRFLSSQACAGCHTVRGTEAAGTIGPDLTHLASRRYIAAGQLPLTRGSLAAWIADPQTIKPGAMMPLVPMSPDDLIAVSAYLARLR